MQQKQYHVWMPQSQMTVAVMHQSALLSKSHKRYVIQFGLTWDTNDTVITCSQRGQIGSRSGHLSPTLLRSLLFSRHPSLVNHFLHRIHVES